MDISELIVGVSLVTSACAALATSGIAFTITIDEFNDVSLVSCLKNIVLLLCVLKLVDHQSFDVAQAIYNFILHLCCFELIYDGCNVGILSR